MEPPFYYEENIFNDIEIAKMRDFFEREKRDKQSKQIADNLYRMRLNRKKRVLYTLIEIDGGSIPYVLEYIPDHDLDGSEIVNKPQILKRVQAAAQARVIALKAKEDAAQSMLEPSAKVTEAKPQPLYFYQNELVAIDPLQNEALRAQLPAILSGVAGSGKSLVALKFLENFINNPDTQDTQAKTKSKTKPQPNPETKPETNPDTPLKVLYLTRSEALKQQIQGNWADSLNFDKTRHKIEFFSLEHFIKEALKKGLSLTDDSYFPEFCQSYFSQKNKHFNTQITIDAPKIREEFLICSGYDTLEAYKALGVKQSTVTDEQREIYYAAYQTYLQKLTADKRVDPDFYAIDLFDGEYDLITMDEAQDLSPYLINSLHSKAKKQKILYCLDPKQRLNSCKSIIPYILKKIDADPKDPKKYIKLKTTHRCPLKVVNAANAILAFQNSLVKNTEKYEAPKIEAVSDKKGLGSLYVCDEESLQTLAWMQAPKQAYFVVITSKKNCEDPKILESIKKRFNTDKVLTPEQAKGLEYEVVLAYDLYDEEILKPFGHQISSLDNSPEESKPDILDPKNAAHQNLITLSNQAYTTYTRAKTALIICEKQKRFNKFLLNKVKKLADPGLPPEDLFSKLSTKEEWEKEVIALLGIENEELAKDTFYKHLELDKDKQEEAFAKFKSDLVEKERDTEVREVKKETNLPLPSFFPRPNQFEHKEPVDRSFPEVADLKPVASSVTVNSKKERKSPIGKTGAKSTKNKISPPQPFNLPALSEPLKPLVIHTPTPDAKSLNASKGLESLLSLIVKQLCDDFSEKKFGELLKLLPRLGLKSLHQIMCTTETGTQSLLNFIREDEDRTKLFFEFIANNSFILKEVPLELPEDVCPLFKNKLNKIKELRDFLNLAKIDNNVLKDKKPIYQLIRKAFEHNSSNKKEYKEGYLLRLQLLAELGADLNGSEKGTKSTLVHYAASFGDATALEFFASQRMDLTTKDTSGINIIHIVASRTDSEEILKLVKKLNLADLLFEATSDGTTPLHKIAEYGDAGILSHFEGLGRDLDPLDDSGIRPSHIAAESGNIALLERFAELGINLERMTSQGRTPLLIAIGKEKWKAVEVLIEKNVNVTGAVFLNSREANCLGIQAYARGLGTRINDLIQDSMYEKVDIKSNKLIPINLAQFALALGNEKIADLIKGKIIERYVESNGFKIKQQRWIEFFSVEEPPRPKLPLSKEVQSIMVTSLFNQDSFNFPTLMAVLDFSEYHGELDRISIKNSQGQELNLLDFMRNNPSVADLFFKWTANNTALLSKIVCEKPDSLHTPFDVKLNALLEIKEMQNIWENAYKPKPIEVIREKYENKSENEDINVVALISTLEYLGADLSITDEKGYGLIHWAARHSHVPLIRFLKAKVDFTKMLPDGRTAAHIAASQNDVKLLKLFKELDLSHLLFHSTPDAQTPVNILAWSGFAEHLDEFTNVKDARGQTYELDAPVSEDTDLRPSHAAASYGKLSVLKKLDELGVNLDQPSIEGTPLSIAIFKNQVDVFHFLSSHPKVNLFRNYNYPAYLETETARTPYLAKLKEFNELNRSKAWVKKVIYPIPLEEMADSYNRTDMAKAIRKKKRHATHTEDKIILPVNRNLVPVDFCETAYIAAYMNDLELLQNLLDQGVDLTRRDEDGFGLAHFAAQAGNLEILQWIALNDNLKDLLSLKSNSDITLAYILAELNHDSALKNLAKWGIDINVPTKLSNLKPVHIAAQQGHVKVMKIFKEHGLLDELTEDTKGVTPLVEAVDAGRRDVVDFLLENGVDVHKKAEITCFKGTQDAGSQFLNAYELSIFKGDTYISDKLKPRFVKRSVDVRGKGKGKENDPSISFFAQKGASGSGKLPNLNSGVSPNR